MCAKWRNEYQPQRIASLIESIKKLENGKVSFSAFEFTEYLTLLESMSELNTTIPHHIKRRIIQQSAMDLAKSQTVTQKRLLAIISKKENEYLKLPLKPFLLISQISIHRMNDLNRVILPNAWITFYNSLPTKLAEERQSIIKIRSHWPISEMPKDYMGVRIRVLARVEHDATNKALDSIDYFRALANYLLVPYDRRTYGATHQALNDVRLGPLHSLHDLKGNLTCQQYWYQPDYQFRSPIKLSSKYPNFIDDYRHIRKKVEQKPYLMDFKDTLLRYVRALDYPDYNTAYLHLWGVLEKLTVTQNESYKTTIRRASVISKRPEYESEVLRHLRDYRNRVVHKGTAISDIETYVYQLKRYVDRMIWFWMNQTFNLCTLDDLAEFLDISFPINDIPRKVRLMKNVYKFHEPFASDFWKKETHRIDLNMENT